MQKTFTAPRGLPRAFYEPERPDRWMRKVDALFSKSLILKGEPMRIIKQSHEILAYDDISMLERAGRTCYQSQDRIGCNDERVGRDRACMGR